MTRDRLAVVLGLLGPVALCGLLVPFRQNIANTHAALLLVALIVAVASLGNRLGGMLATVSAALCFDFFLTRPYEAFSIRSRTDLETAVLLFVVGAGVTELAVWGRRQHERAAQEAGYLDGLHAAAEVAATGGSPTELADRVAEQLVGILDLQACRFVFQTGLGSPRLQHDGAVVWAGRPWDVEHDGLPPDQATELVVTAGGRFWGRFLLTPRAGSRPTSAQRSAAVALADQVGAALGGYHPDQH